MSDEVRNLIAAENRAEEELREQALAAKEAVLANARNYQERYIQAFDSLINSKLDEAADIASRGGASQAVVDQILALKVSP